MPNWLANTKISKSKSRASARTKTTARKRSHSVETSSSISQSDLKPLNDAIERLVARVDAIERRWKVDPPDLTDKQIRDLEDGMPGVASYPK